MPDETIVHMQERITYLEKTVEDLNEVVTGLNDKINRLTWSTTSRLITAIREACGQASCRPNATGAEREQAEPLVFLRRRPLPDAASVA